METPTTDLYRLDRNITRAELVDELAAFPDRLRTCLNNPSDAALERKPAADEWSPIEIVRHIRDAVQVYGMRFKWIILDEEPLLPNYDENRWAAESPDSVPQLDAMLREIEAYRAETTRLLRSLPPQGWSRRGRHEVIGWLELDPYVRHELAHEEQHLSQLQSPL